MRKKMTRDKRRRSKLITASVVVLWYLRFGLSDLEAKTWQAAYTAQGFKRTSSYTCGSVNVAVVEVLKVRSGNTGDFL